MNNKMDCDDLERNPMRDRNCRSWKSIWTRRVNRLACERVLTIGHWIKTYPVPRRLRLEAKKKLIEALTRRLFNHTEHGLNISWHPPARSLRKLRERNRHRPASAS